MTPGFIYVGYRADCTKIGYTGNPKNRWAAHRADWGGEIGFSYLFEFPTKEKAKRVERCVHSKLRGQKQIGGLEFYRMTNAAAIEVIRECAGADLVHRKPADFIKRPEAFTPFPLREGDVPAYSEEGLSRDA